MERWVGRVALVTGASAGIGAAICKALVKEGMKVVGCARNVDRIHEMTKQLASENLPGSLHGIKCDVTKEDEVNAMFDEIKAKYGKLDVCVNNAGVGEYATLLDGKTDQWRKMMEVNVMALCVCTREAVKIMRDNKIDDGQIIHICSDSGHVLTVDEFEYNFYCGTKFMVKILGEGLRRELRNIKSTIRVMSVSPGYVETEFEARMNGDESAKKFYNSMRFIKPEDIADIVVYGLKAPPSVDINDVLLRPTDQKY